LLFHPSRSHSFVESHVSDAPAREPKARDSILIVSRELDPLKKPPITLKAVFEYGRQLYIFVPPVPGDKLLVL
jgi:hypothetical protein